MKFHIITLGCKVNQYESNYMSESLVSNGFSFCDTISGSDIVIINTCSVTDTADKKCLKTLHRVKKENPHAIKVICGCSSQNNKEMYEKEDVQILIGTSKKAQIVDLINNYIKTKEKYVYINNNRDVAFEDMFINDFNQVRCYIKIEDGCDNFCTYCIIPFVRGKVRSKDYNEVLKEAKSLTSKGFKEIVLTGIDTGSYNDNNHNLTDLINDLSEINGLERIRLSSVEITELDKKFLDIIKNNKVFCDHLHIPLQAGSDNILKKMNRKYDLKTFEEKINILKCINKDIAITTDVIVGFPGESEDDFINTYDFCKKIAFSKIHVFPYSDRTGTAASRLSDKVSELEKKKRVAKLISLSEFLEKDYYDKFRGKEMDVLIETCKDNISVGHTSNYLKVTLNENLEVGKIYKRKLP